MFSRLKKLSQNNKEAIKSSLMVGLAYSGIVGGVLSIGHKPYALEGAGLFFLVGFVLGLATTWYPDE